MRSGSRPRAELRTLLRAARRGAFKAMPALTGSSYARILVLEQVRSVLERSREIGEAPFAEKDAVLDRALQAYSAHYRVTRRLGWRLGARFKPRIIPRQAAITHWVPGRPFIPYAPHESRIHELLTSSPLSSHDTWLRFRRLRDEVLPLYHELNHAIILRLLRPARAQPGMGSARSMECIRRYYSFIEALVTFRDIAIAEELGPLASPFAQCGAIYFTLPGHVRLGRGATAFDSFVSCVLHAYGQTLGYRNREIEALFAAAGRKLIGHPYFKVHQSGMAALTRQWFRNYFRKNGERLRLPPPAPRSASPRLEFHGKSPEDLVRDTAGLRRVHRWYSAVFRADA